MSHRLSITIFGVGLLVATALLSGTQQAAAQNDAIKWSAPLNLSNTPQSSAHPAIVADGFGNVHVVWSEDADGGPMAADTPHFGSAIFHRRWDGNSWSPANDIIYLPDDILADFPAVAVDPGNYLHMVWTGQSNLYYSTAPAWRADSAQAWSKPIVIAPNSARTMWESGIIADSLGQLHVIYATRGSDAGVYYIRSTDGGDTWSTPSKLSKPFDQNEESFSRLRIVTDRADRIHATWQTNQREGFGQAIYYARSTDGGQTWSTPRQLGYRNAGDFDVGWAYLLPSGMSDLNLIYNAGENRGRYQRISHDGGETWTDPVYIISEMEGINGYNVPLLDGAGRLHLVINMRAITQVFGMFYSQWLGNNWAPVTQIATEGPAVGAAHYTAAVANRGNEIHVVWNDISGGEIVYMRGTMQDLAAAPVQPTPTAPGNTVAAAVTPNPTPLSTVLVAPAQIDTTLPPRTNTVDTNPAIPGIIAALGLVALAVVGIRLRRQSH